MVNNRDSPPPYKFIIDACAIFDQKENRPYNREVFPALWDNIEKSIEEQIIVSKVINLTYGSLNWGHAVA
jgi:hypothetical protein